MAIRTNYIIRFTDTTLGSPSEWLWDFNDGTTASVQNPTHSYTTPGTYNVGFTASGAYINSSIEIVSGITASFTTSTASTTPDTGITFSDTSLPFQGSTVSLLWDFGDGTTASSYNPTHSYSATGSYLVGLTASDDFGSDYATASIEVSSPISITASFTTSTQSMYQDTVITFTDTSVTDSGTISNWIWDFGDGATSSVQNPTYSYSTPGDYVIGLTATNGGSSYVTASVSIYGYEQLSDFPANVRNGSAFEIDGTIYLAGFRDDDISGVTTSTFTYDPLTDTYGTAASLPSTITNPVGFQNFIIGTVGYIVDAGDVSQTFYYDYIQDEWFTSTDLPVKSAGGSGVNVGTYGYIEVGISSGGAANRLYRYDTSGVWTRMTDAPTGGYAESAFTLNDDTIYQVFGQDFGQTKDFYSYSVSSNSWSTLTDAPYTEKDGASSITFNNKGYIFTGRGTSNTFVNEVQRYDGNSWETLPNQPFNSRGQTIAAYDDYIYLFTGYDQVNSSPTYSVWRFRPRP